MKRSGSTGELIGLMADPSPRLLVGMLGILESGHGFVPIDPAYPAERARFIVDECRTEVLITEAKYVEKARQLRADSAFLKHIVCLDRAEAKGNGGGEAALYDFDDYGPLEAAGENGGGGSAAAAQTAYVIFTSGSTGQPKGVPISHENLIPLLRWGREYFDFGEHTAALQNLSYCFDFGVFEILSTLLFGGTLHFLDRSRLESLSAYADYVNGHALNTIHSTPSFFREVISAGGDLRTLRTLHLGGEQLTPATVEHIFGKVGDECVVYNGYGPTEATINCSIFKVGSKSAPSATHAYSVPIGKPSAGNSLYVLGDDYEPVPVGVSGQLYVGGVGLASGYLNRPALTAEKYVPHPFGLEPGERLYATGDLVRFLPDGNIEFLGRIDEQVKVRGFRIEPGEIEAALRQHPSVREAVVTLQEGASGDRRLVAHIVAADGRRLPGAELRQFLKERLPAHMIPSAFVCIDSLPLTTSGKIDRRALPSPEEPHAGEESGYVAPRTPTEEVLSVVWASMLGRIAIGLYDNFFELGGHSLLATQLISRVRDAFGVELPLYSLFAAPTMGAMARKIDAVKEAGQSRPPAITAAPRRDDLPLSFAQQRLWFIDQLEPGNPAYNIPGAFRLRGSLRVDALEAALGEIVRRHETLRTSFTSDGGHPAQVISPPAPVRLPVKDLGDMDEAACESEVRRLVHEESRRPFDLSRGPLWRAELLRLSQTEHLLLFTVHHIIFDGWSSGVLLRELGALYRAHVDGEPAPLPDLPLQYADYARWQREWLRGEVLSEQLDYWRRQLEGAPAVVNLPTDRPRPAVQTYRGQTESLSLPAALTEQLQALSRRHGVTLFMTLMSAFQVLLYRYTGQDDFVVSTGVSNRGHSEIENLIGCFINILLIRGDLAGDPRFDELLGRVRERMLTAYARQDVPFELLVEELHPERDLSYNPLTQVMLVLQNSPSEGLALLGLKVDAVPVERVTAQLDLTLHVWEEAGGLSGFMEYNADLFDAATVARMLKHFETLLSSLAAEPARSVSELSLITEEERHRLLVEWNDSAADYPHDRCLHHPFEAHARCAPEAPALFYRDEQLSYGELNARANRLAHHLRAMGVGPEVRVCLCVERSVEMVVGILGILKAGGAYVPLDPTYPPERLAFMLADSRAGIILTQSHLAGRLPADGARVVRLDAEDEIPSGPEGDPQSGVGPENLAYVIYTSGSTGRPKGVAIRHGGVLNNINDLNRRFRIGAEARVLALSSLSFDMCVYEVLGTLEAGGAVVMPEAAMLREPAHWAALIKRHRVTVWNSAPSLLEMLVQYVTPRPALHPDSLRVALLGGDWVPIMLPDQLKAVAEDVRVIVMGGATEASIHSIIYEVEETDAGWRSIPYGVPMANQKAYVLDRHAQLVPVGVAGELHLGGVGLARGYFDHPGMTAERFVPHSFADRAGERLYKTGDLARYMADGNIELLGRMDHQVKIRGFRIELGEIGAALKQHPAVKEAVVILRQDVPGQKRLVAYVVAGGARVSADELRTSLKSTLPEYMVPSAFVLLDALPLSPNGKLDRRALPAPEAAQPAGDDDFVAPRTPVEEVLADIWAQVLGVARVGAFDNFFDLGGHSLLATQVVSRVNELFPVELPLRVLFEARRLADLGEALEEHGRREQVDVCHVAYVVRELSRLSDDEARVMLAEKRTRLPEVEEAQ